MTARPIRYQRQVSDRNGKIFYTSITSLSHISKDLRLLVYGTDTMQLMLRMGQYYTALYAGSDDRAALLWRQIDTLEQRLEQYYMPLTFSTDCLDLISNDALTRTQLREVIARCRKFRIDQHWEDAVC